MKPCLPQLRAGARAASLAALALPALALAQPQATLPPPPASPAPVVKLEYFAKGNFKKSVLAPGAGDFATAHDYDRLDRRTRTVDARGKTTGFAYNGREDLTQVTDPRSLLTQYPRNGLGDVTGLTSPDTGTASHTLDEAGNLKTRLDSRGALATYSYDAINRLRSVIYSQPGQPSQSFTWNYDQTGAGFSYGVGRLTSTQYPSGSTRYAHDAQGRVVSSTQTVDAESNSITLSIGYTYDAAGRITRITYPSGRVLDIPHNGGVPTGLSLTLTSSASAMPLISALTLEPAVGGQGPARSWLWHLDSGTLAHERVFDVWGRMVRHPLGGAVRDIRYDAADRIASYAHLDASNGAPVPALDQGFGYDELGRLTTVNTSIGSWTYGYDDNGNRTLLNQTTPAGSSSRSHSIDPGSNRLLAISNPSRGFSHDAAGNTLADSQGWVGFNATYDPSGRMSRIRASSDGRYFTTTVLAYDGAGQRVLKFPQVLEDCRNGPDNGCRAMFYPSPVVYVHDTQGRLLGEYDGRTGAPLREYVWLQDMPLVIIDGAGRSPALYYVHTDHLDTPRTVIDRQGRQRWSWVAEPFGNSAAVTNPVGFGDFELNLRMPGQYFDNETGLSDNWHRSYSAGLGRYTQSDPIGLAGGINTYSYVGGDPVGYFDEDGLNRRGGTTSAPNRNVASHAQANSLINQIQQINPQFQYPAVMSAPGQGGYSTADVQFLGRVLARAKASCSCPGSGTNWPTNPRDMDGILGVPGVARPDGPFTQGRGTIVWRPRSNLTIKYECHPYDTTAPSFHRGPHWHVEGPAGANGRPAFRDTYVPTEQMPGR